MRRFRHGDANLSKLTEKAGSWTRSPAITETLYFLSKSPICSCQIRSHGDLVELGNEEFHAEVVHGEAGSVTVYILDSAAKVTVPIDATELTINVSHDG